jgi:hypothetical protein
MSIIRLALLCALLGFLPAAANSQPAAAQADAIGALRQGGHVIVSAMARPIRIKPTPTRSTSPTSPGSVSSMTTAVRWQDQSANRCTSSEFP